MQHKKQQMNAEIKFPATQEKSEVFPLASDVKLTETQRNSDLGSADAQCSTKLCRCTASDVSSRLSALDKIWELGRTGRDLDSRGKLQYQAMLSSNNLPLCRTSDQQRLANSIRPRSLEVTKDFKVNVQDHEYENVQQVFRMPLRAASGSCLHADKGGNREDESHGSSSTSVSATATTPVGRITSSASVDTAIDRSARMCECTDVDLMSYRLMYNSVELESAAKKPVGVSRHRFHEDKGAEVISNQTAHCSRPRTSGEISLLNKDLLKHCSQKTRSVSMPIDIVAAQRLPPDQRLGNSLSSAVNTATAGPGQLTQPICSGYSLSSATETKAERKRAYRVGLNLFNRYTILAFSSKSAHSVFFSFLSRVSTLKRDIDIAILSVCPSVCMSRSGIR